jgi:hypothetical protein
MKNATNLLLHISGGIGKCILATAVIRSYREANPESKVVVVSGYPEVFINNPDVHKNFSFATAYLWQDYYGQPGWKVSAHDPYMEEAWIKNYKVHLVDIWCNMLGVPSVQKTPLLFFSGPELDDLQTLASSIITDLPLMVVQSTGGANPGARSWTRNPSTEELNDLLGQFKATHFIVHLCLRETPVLTNANDRLVDLNRRQAMALVYYAEAFVGIDSFGMHARAANPDSGSTFILFPLAESVERLGYAKKDWINVVPVQAVQDILQNHTDYFATIFKLSIDSSPDNCPVPAGMKWFS